MILGMFNNEPDFVNDEGIKWWMVSGKIWAVQHPDGLREYVGIHNGEIVVNSQQLDAVALKLELIDYEEQTRPKPDVPARDVPQQQGAPAWMKPKPETLEP